MSSLLIIAPYAVPIDASPEATGLPYESYVPRCPCGWAGPRTRYRDTAVLNLRLHSERCDQGQEGLW